MNPSKGFYDVLKESQVGHEMYKKTHNDYNPSEKINRGYVGYFTQKVSHTTIDGHNSSITINFLLLFETG